MNIHLLNDCAPPEQMQAAVWQGGTGLKIETVPVPAINTGELLVQVEACGLCPTDIKKIDLALMQPPVILGHEMAGRVVAAGIALVTMPIVARLFTPGDFGVAALFMSIIGIISTVSALRYEGALVLPKEDEEALTLMAFAYRVLFTSLITLFVVLVVYTWAGTTWQVLELLGVFLVRFAMACALLFQGYTHSCSGPASCR